MAARRPSLYGVSFELPDGWNDTTEYGFVAEQGALAQVSFQTADVPEAKIESFLLEIQQRFERQEHSYIGRIHAYQQRHFPARGLECRVGENADTADYVGVVIVPYGAGSLTICGQGAAGYAEPFRRIVESLSPWLRGRPPREGEYRVFDLVFESDVPLRAPSEFEFSDGRASLYCRYASAARPFAEPSWATEFGLDPGATLTFVVHGTPKVVAVSQLMSAEELHTGAIASSPAARRELFTGSARVVVGDRWLELRYLSSMGIVQDEARWMGFLRSLEREA